jgi:hypothetical protein
MSYLQEKLNNNPEQYSSAVQEQVIRDHYNSISTLVDAFVKGKTAKRGLIVNGPNGGGKTEVVKHTLDSNQATYHIINGSMTAPQLYIQLYKHARNTNQILIIDDTDVVLEDTEMCDLLKAAIDTGNGKKVDYAKSNSAALRLAGVPTSFICKGRVILISNKLMTIDGCSRKQQQSIKPVRDRCMYIPAGLTPAWTAVAMNILFKYGHIRCFAESELSSKVKAEILKFVSKEVNRLPGLSFRTLVTCMDMYNIDPKNWKNLVMMDQGV